MYHHYFRLRKILAAVLCLSLIFGSAVSLAETVTLKGVSDNQAPDISNVKITEGGQTLKIGQTIHVSAKITDKSVIESVWCYMTSNVDYGFDVYLDYNPETDLYEGTYTFTKDDANAEYYISSIDVYDEYGNNRWTGGKKYGVVALNDPGAATGAGYSVTALLLEEYNKTLKPGDTIHFALTMNRNDNLNAVEVYLHTPSDGNIGITLDYSPANSCWMGVYTFDEYDENGAYYTEHVEYAVSRSDGGWRWYSTNLIPYQTVTLAGAAVPKTVDLTGVDLVQKGMTLKGGETIQVLARVSDSSLVSGMSAFFSLQNYTTDYDKKDSTNYYNSTETRGFSVDLEYNSSTGRFEGTGKVDERLVNGVWYLSDVEMYLTNGKYEWKDTGKSLYFTFNGPDLVSSYIDDFVADAYFYILDRDVDASGKKSWGEQLASGKLTGAAFIEGLIGSVEFQNKKLPVADVVEILYRSMLRRASDPAGKKNWVDEINSGKSYSAVINGFAGSTEFRGLCHRYGITPGAASGGATPAPAPADKTEGAKKFATRCYQVILGREPDTEGLNNWSKLIADGKRTAAEIILNFMSSAEYTGKKPSNADKVETLYQAMLGRASDAAGKANWVGLLDQTGNINTIINGFSNSEEFTAICKEYGITPGSVDKGSDAPKPAADEEKVKAFVKHLYKNALNRDADAAGLADWTKALVGGTTDAKKVTKSFVTSAEVTGKKLDDEGFVKMLYKVCMNREADAEGLTNWKNMLAGGATREQVIDSFLATAEFKDFAATFGL